MKLRLFSDLHREFQPWDIPALENEDKYVVVLAGDIAVSRKHSTYDNFLRDLCERHRAVVYVPGNHEYYGSSFDRAWDNIVEMTYGIPNLHHLNGESVVIDDVLFIGATLWTNFDDGDARAMELAGMYMNDYHSITRLASTDSDDGWAYRGKLSPTHTWAEHLAHRQFIDDALKANQGEGSLMSVVVTHHGPTLQSIDPSFHGDQLNAAYVSDLSELIREREPLVWVHGHTHHSVNYTESKTRVFSNPKGYPTGAGHQNPAFIEDGLIPELNEILDVQ